MAQIIDSLYRNKMLGQRPDWIKKMSDEELASSIKQLEVENATQNRNKIGSAIGDLGNIFLQKGGLSPVSRSQPRSENIDDIILRETLKSKIRDKDIPTGSTPPGWWRDPATGRVYKVNMEEVQEAIPSQEQAIQPKPEDNVPEGLWRDPLTNKIHKLPTQATNKDQDIPTRATSESTWRDPATGIVYKKTNSDRSSATKTKAQISATNELIKTVEVNKIKKQQITEAEDALKRIPTGLGGKLQIGWMENVDPNNPILSDWQKVKMVLTDAQLLNTANTKGAISDKEMELFAKAAANNDIASISKIKPVLKRLLDFMNAEEKSQAEAYKANFGVTPPVAFQSKQSNQDDRNQAKQILLQKGYSEQEAEQMLGE